MAYRVGAGELKNGFALVRPPGHHAEPEQAMYVNKLSLALVSCKAWKTIPIFNSVFLDINHSEKLPYCCQK